MMGRTLTSTKTLAPSASVTPTAKEGGILAPPETRVAALTTPPKAGEVFTLSVGSGVTMELVLIRPGTFTMGSDACSNATPHKVTITKPFYLGKFEVTQEQWQAVTGSNPSNFKGTKQPVESVSWEDCRIFLRELQTKLPGQKFRLPTEAEWEYACRAGSTTTYCYGDDDIRLGGYAWYDQNSDNTAHPVGEKKPNAWGLHDMHGNVREWCADWYGDYPNGEATDPTGPGSGSIRVLRGGPWNGVPGTCRSANRLRESPGRRFTNVGFRLCLDFP
jgi:formylglycine-generating enzyme required for sulfatase activity